MGEVVQSCKRDPELGRRQVMRMVSEVWQRLLRLFFRSQEEREMDEELRFHIDKETEKNLAEGMSPSGRA